MGDLVAPALIIFQTKIYVVMLYEIEHILAWRIPGTV